MPVKPLCALAALVLLGRPGLAQTAGDTERVYTEDGLTTTPVLLRQPAVVYPDSLKRVGIGGTVRVSLVVDRKGRPEPASVYVVSSPDTGLNAAARAAVLGSRFVPGRLGKHDVPTFLTLGVLFDPLDTARAPSPIYAVDDSLTERPRLLFTPPFEYPRDMRESRIEGRVLVQMIIDTLGRPEPESIQFVTLPDLGFRLPVLQFLASARFQPARHRGQAVRCIVYLPIDFRISGSMHFFPAR